MPYFSAFCSRIALVCSALAVVPACTVVDAPDDASPTDDPGDPGAQLPDMVVSASTRLDTPVTLGSLHVAAGAVLTVNVDRLVVRGDVILEEGATIESPDRLTLVVEGALDHQGVMRAAGDLVVVSDEARLPTAAELEDSDEHNEVSVDDPQAADADEAETWQLLGDLVAGHVSPRTRASVGKKGRRGGTVFISTGRRALLGPRAGQARRTFEVKNGEEGQPMQGCDVTGGEGGRGGKLFLYATGWRLKNLDIVGGNGGRGGDAFGAGCADGDENRAGDGARPGTMKIRASRYLVVDGRVAIDGFHAGHGGWADITGAPTASVSAMGGDGASIRGYRASASGMTFATAASVMVLDVAHGGIGGNAAAFAGDGVDATCAVGALPGGHAFAFGGVAGDVELTTVSLPNGVDASLSFMAGHGGDAMAVGGRGGHGADCQLAGTPGAPGGDGMATAADGGASSHGADGMDGQSDDGGGRGGDGGHGLDDQRCQSMGADGAPGGHAGNGLAGDGGHGGDGLCAIDVMMLPMGLGGNGGDGGDSLLGDGGNGGNAGCQNGLPGAGGLGLASNGKGGAAC